MSSWWDYTITVYGDTDKLKDLEKALPNDLTYVFESGEQTNVFHHISELENHYGFLVIHA
jgi:hypothetical protein